MNIDTYFLHPIAHRKEIVKEANVSTSPLWLSQLHLAVKNNSPLGLNFLDKRLGVEYWMLIKN